MNNERDKIKYSLDFLIPVDWILDIARRSTDSSDERHRVLGKAILDFTKIAHLTKDNLIQDKDTDLAPYLDFWFGDAIDIAKASLKDGDSNLRTLAECVIDQEKSVVKSKEAFLREVKRVSGSRNEH